MVLVRSQRFSTSYLCFHHVTQAPVAKTQVLSWHRLIAEPESNTK